MEQRQQLRERNPGIDMQLNCYMDDLVFAQFEDVTLKPEVVSD